MDKYFQSRCIYLDINALYSMAMTEKLPISNIIKLDRLELPKVLNKIKDNSFIAKDYHEGYWFEITFRENSINVQNQSDMLPFALENRKIHYYNISDFMKQFLSKNDKNISYDRLIGHHGVKSHYFVSGVYIIMS